jgi:hypothetical protein
MFTHYTKRALFLMAAILVLCSCHNYFKVRSVNQTSTKETAARLDSLGTTNRYLILRNGTGYAYRVTNLRVQPDRRTATVFLDTINTLHLFYLSGGGGNSRYKKAMVQQEQVVNEAHIYQPFDKTVKRGDYVLELDKVQRIEMLQHDAKRSTNSHVLGALGVAAGSLLIATLIFAATWEWQ